MARKATTRGAVRKLLLDLKKNAPASQQRHYSRQAELIALANRLYRKAGL